MIAIISKLSTAFFFLVIICCIGWWLFERISPVNAEAAKGELSRKLVLRLVWESYTKALPDYQRVVITKLEKRPQLQDGKQEGDYVIAAENQVMKTGRTVELTGSAAKEFCQLWRRLPHSILSRAQVQHQPFLVQFYNAESIELQVTIDLFSALPGYGSIEIPVGFGNRRMISFSNESDDFNSLEAFLITLFRPQEQ